MNLAHIIIVNVDLPPKMKVKENELETHKPTTLYPPSFLFKIKHFIDLDDEEHKKFLKELRTVHGG